MREKMNVQYVIADAISDKILYIKKTEVDHSEISSIGKQALSLQKDYVNSYVMIKIY